MTYYNVQDSLYITTSGSNIGIGITNPSKKLEVVGDIDATTDYNINGTQVLSATTLGSGVVNSSLTSLGAQAENLDMGDYQISGAKKIFLDSDSITNKVNLTRSDNSSAGFRITQATNQVISLNQSENANMNLSTNNITRLRLEAAGDINAMSNNIIGVADISFTSATLKGHMIPDTDDAYDIGSATYKIRDLYVSDNSMWIGDTHKISISGGKMKFRKRKTLTVPAAIVAAAQAADSEATESSVESAAIAHASVVNLAAMKLKHWKAYMRTISNQSGATIQDIFRDNADDYADQTSAENWLESGTKTYNKVGNVGIGTSDPSALLSLHYDPESSQGLKELMRLSWHDANYDTLKGDGVKISFHQPDTNNFPGTEEAGYFGVMKANAVEADKESDITIANNDGTNIVERIRILANGDVGIGDSTPSYKLDVAGDINFTGTLRQNGSAYSSGAFTVSSGEAYYMGNVGIGTTNPGNPLHIYSTSNTRPLQTETNGLSQNGYLFIGTNNSIKSQLQMIMDIPTTENTQSMRWNFKDDQSENFWDFLDFTRTGAQAGYMKLGIDGSDTCHLYVNGNVGIGTTSPDALLHVSGTTNPVIARVSTSDNQTARLELCETAAGQHGGYMEYRGGDSDRVKIGVINQYTDTAALTINDNGKVGILKTPSYELDVAGDINFTGSLLQNGSAYSSGSSVWSESSNVASYGSGTTGTIKINSNDSVDKIQLTKEGSTGSKINHSSGWSIDYYGGPGNDSGSTGKHRFFTTESSAYSEKMCILSNGNIGIGTSSPGDKLHIYENADDSIQLKIENAYASSRAGLSLVNDSNTFNIQCNGGNAIIENYGSGGTHFYQKSTGDYVFRTTDSNTTRFIIKTGGWIGMGCSPNASLEIEDTSPTIRLTDGRSNYGNASGVQLGALEFYSRDGSMDGDYASVAKIKIVSDNTTVAPDGAMVFLTGVNGTLSEGMRISSSGKVGIGTDVPSIDLAIGDSDTGFNWVSDGNLAFYSNNQERFRLDNNGNFYSVNGGYIQGKQHMCDIELDGGNNGNDVYKNKNQNSGSWRYVYLKHTRTSMLIPKASTEYKFNRSFTINVGFDDSTYQNTTANANSTMYQLKCSVKGIYQFSYSLKMKSNQDATMEIVVLVNNTGTWHGYSKQYCHSGNVYMMTGSGIVRMAANDYINVKCYSSAANSGGHNFNDGRIQVCMIGTY